MSILTNLRSATKGLVVTSESDAPLKPFVWQGVTVDSQAALLAQLKLDAATPVTELSVEAFFAPFTTPQSWHTDEDKADLVRFTALVAQLSTLTDPKAYRLGAGPEIQVYVLGKTPDGSAAGVATQLTET